MSTPKISVLLLLFLVFTIVTPRPQNSMSDDEDDMIEGGSGYNDYDEYSGQASGDYEYGEKKQPESSSTDLMPTQTAPEVTQEEVTEQVEPEGDDFDEILTPVIEEDEVTYETDEVLEPEQELESSVEPTEMPIDEDYFAPPEEDIRVVDVIDLKQGGSRGDQGLFSWINDFWGEKYFLAALLAGAIIGFIIISLVILFICYTVRKSDEGSYTIPKNLTLNKYGNGATTGATSTLGTQQEYKYKPGGGNAPEYFA